MNLKDLERRTLPKPEGIVRIGGERLCWSGNRWLVFPFVSDESLNAK
jgi:hypothetical protein